MADQPAPSDQAEYSRHNPSPHFRELAELYQKMHVEGDPAHDVPAKLTFDGRSLMPYCPRIKKLIDEHGAVSILDYGSGKGLQYGTLDITDGEKSFTSVREYWGVDTIVCYDPGYIAFSKLPSGWFDGVICTDVLEHCPEQDMAWIIDEIFSFARYFVFGSIALYRASKTLPNGENAHCTLKPIDWWYDIVADVAKSYPDIRYVFSCEQQSRTDRTAADVPSFEFSG